jgi:hypothetical protein
LDLAPDFDEFCALLIDHHAEFVILGAYALAFHGAPRFTGTSLFEATARARQKRWSASIA